MLITQHRACVRHDPSRRNVVISILLAAVMLFAFTGCGLFIQKVETPAETVEPTVIKEPRERVDCLLSFFNEDEAVSMDNGLIDLSSAANGYIAVRITDSERLKFRVIMGDEIYTYDLPNDGSTAVFPLNMGDGEYELRLMRNTGESNYQRAWTGTVNVTMADEFQPFLRPNIVSSYDSGSECVELAYEISKFCDTDTEAAAAIYDYIVNNIVYDEDKAESVESGYVSDPEATLASKTGICYDFAALTAAMMRSQGIPCKIVNGYVGEDQVYHSWNMIYLENDGQLTDEISVSAGMWKRIDTTYASMLTEAEWLENDELYDGQTVY